MKRLLLIAVAIVVLATATGTRPAEAHFLTFQGPVHYHVGTCTRTDCYRWINQGTGHVYQGPYSVWSVHYFAGYVGVLCSLKYVEGGVSSWHMNLTPIGAWGQPGKTMPFCQTPTKYNPRTGIHVRWPMLP